VSERTIGYPARVWRVLGPDTVVGYDLDALGEYRMSALLVFAPTSEKIRTIGLRELERMPAMLAAGSIQQDNPPTPEQVGQWWEKQRQAGETLTPETARSIAEQAERTARTLKRATWADAPDSYDPPPPAFLVAMIADELEARKLREELAQATEPEQLARRAGESPDEFYERIARAYRVLEQLTDRPTTELARRAGVSKGTAASWLTRARQRGVLTWGSLPEALTWADLDEGDEK
jgi:hypothetical protein